MIGLIPHGQRLLAFTQIASYLQHAQEWALGRKNMDDMAADVLNPLVQLWVVYDEATARIYGYLATEIRKYPQARHLAVLHCAGEDGYLDQCVDMVFLKFEAFARDNDCDAVEIQGRAAWAKFVKPHGYEAPFKQYIKYLKEKP